MKTRSLIAVLMIPLFLLACATFVKNSYIGIDGTAVSYATIMTGVSAAQATGKITADQRANINKYALIEKSLIFAACDALVAYNDNSSTTLQGNVATAISALLANWVDMANLINSILPGAVPVSALNAVTLKGKTAVGQTFTITVKKLDTGQISIIVQIGAAVVAYLIPAIQSLIADLGKVSISDADILALKTLIKDPELY